MIFHVSRFLLLGILFGTVISLIRKHEKFRSKAARFLLFIAATAIVMLAAALPPENLFLRFPTPEAAFSYYSFSGTVEQVIEGEESCMVVAAKSPSETQITWFPRDSKGYKLPYGILVQTAERNSGSWGSYSIQRVTGTGDYYFEGQFFSSGETVTISDSCGSEFSIDTFYASKDITVFSVKAFITDYSGNYTLHLNGEEILPLGAEVTVGQKNRR